MNNIDSIERAADFAEKVGEPEVWSRLANAYLGKYEVADAIECFLKAKDHS